MLCLQRRQPSITPAAPQDSTKHVDKTLPAMAVHPLDATDSRTRTLINFSLRAVVISLYHWITCLFILGLVCSQLLGAIRDSTETQKHRLYGRSPLLGPYQIVGTDNVPYPDRVIACVRKGKVYEPRLVSSLLAEPGISSILEDSTGTAVHGYRLRQRHGSSDNVALDSVAEPVYKMSCNLIASTIDNIFHGCQALGYTNITRDNLRVVDDWDSKNLYVLLDTLPVLIMPLWDNALVAHHILPTWIGDTCAFSLQIPSASADNPMASFRGVNRSVRYERTISWLNRPGGFWKNGWYEDPEGMRWYSDVHSSAAGPLLGMMDRVFDVRTGKELDCYVPEACKNTMLVERWGDRFYTQKSIYNFTLVYIANGTEFGHFLFESHEKHIIHSIFDWETLLSNTYTGVILYRWILSQILVAVRAYHNRRWWFGSGISCVSASESFNSLLLASLPHLGMTLAAFWTVGCEFEGQQGAFAEAWFTIYPAIAQLMIIYYSLLNLLAKVLRRRVSDVLFTPSLIVLCLLHYFRREITESGLLSGVDGRVLTLVFSDEVSKLQLLDYFTTDIIWRMNGRVTLIFAIKLSVLAVNFLPILLSRPFPIHSPGSDLHLQGVEKALVLCVGEVGGLSSSLPYMIFESQSNQQTRFRSALRTGVRSNNGKSIIGRANVSVKPIANQNKDPCNDIYSVHQTSTRQVAFVNSLELIRVGYLIFGDLYVTTFEEWTLFTAIAPFRSLCHFWNHRVFVWVLRPPEFIGDVQIAGGRSLESLEPQMWRLDDPRLQKVSWWKISTCSIEC